MEPEEKAVINPEMNPSSDKNFLQRLIGILLEPGETLQEIARCPTWIWALLLSLLVVSVPMVLQTERVPREMRVKAVAEQAAQFSGQDVKKIEEAMLAQEEGVWAKYQSAIFILPFGILITLLIAGILLGSFLLAGSPLSFKNSMAAYCWGSLPPTLAIGILSIVFLYLKDPGDLNPLDPLGNVISHLGILTDKKTHPGLYSLLSSLDLFSLWRIYLLGLGYSVATYEKTGLQKSILVIVILWLLYVLGKTGIAMILS